MYIIHKTECLHVCKVYSIEKTNEIYKKEKLDITKIRERREILNLSYVTESNPLISKLDSLFPLQFFYIRNQTVSKMNSKTIIL